MEDQFIDHLKMANVFSCLTKKERNDLKPYIYRRTYKKGQYLFLEGDPRVRIYILLEGFVVLEKTNLKGNVQYINYVKENEVFPLSGLFADAEYHYNAIAETDISVFYMMTETFEELATNKKEMLKQVIHQMNALLKLQENWIHNAMTPSAHQRVLNAIQYLMEDLGDRTGEDIVIHCPITTTKLSIISGTSRETVSMVLNKLKKDEVLSVKEKMLYIHDHDFFKQLTK